MWGTKEETPGLTSGPAEAASAVKTEEEKKSEYSYYSSAEEEERESSKEEDKQGIGEKAEEDKVREDKKAPVCEADLRRSTGERDKKDKKRKEQAEEERYAGLSTLPKKLSVGPVAGHRDRGQERPRSPLMKPGWSSHAVGHHGGYWGYQDWGYSGGRDDRAPLPRRPAPRPKPKSKGRKRRTRGQAFKAKKKTSQQKKSRW